MALIDYLITNTSQLPWIVLGPGLFLIVMFLFKALGQFFRLKWISAIGSILYALIIALILARYGQDIAAYVLNYLDKLEKPPSATSD